MFNESHTILIVDDEEGIAEVLCELIAIASGANVLYKTNPLEAVEYLESAQVDLLITDHSMPQMQGMDLIAKVIDHDNYNNTFAVLMSGYANQEFNEYSEELRERVVFSSKPITVKQLFQDIGAYTQRDEAA